MADTEGFTELKRRLAGRTNTNADEWHLTFKARQAMQVAFQAAHAATGRTEVVTQVFTCVTAVDPILLVKPPQSSNEANQPIAISDVPVSLLDVMPTAFACAGISDSGAGDGVNAFTVDNPNRVRTYRHLSKDDEGQEHGVVEYEIVGDSSDLGNWHPTGWVLHYPEGTWEQR